MSDIPVGSPPAPPGRHAAPGGWYPDPLDPARERYWDGWQWSRTTREAEHPPAGPVPGGQGPYGVAAPGAGVGGSNGGNGHAGPYGSPYGAAPGPNGYAPGPYGSAPQGYPARVPGVSRQAATTADGVPLAGWWWRALAGLVDALLVGVVSGLLTLPFYTEALRALSTFYGQVFAAVEAGSPPPPTPNFAATISGTDQLWVVLITLLVGLAYHLPLLRFRAATLGMAACGLRVVPVDEGRAGPRLEWSRVVVRALLWVLPGALSLRILTVADVLLPLWHPKRQTVHDLAARTQVVRLR